MARGRGASSGMDRWVQELGERIGRELGQVIAEGMRHTLAKSVDTKGPGSNGKRGRGALAAKSTCTAPGCGEAVAVARPAARRCLGDKADKAVAGRRRRVATAARCPAGTDSRPAARTRVAAGEVPERTRPVDSGRGRPGGRRGLRVAT